MGSALGHHARSSCSVSDQSPAARATRQRVGPAYKLLLVAGFQTTPLPVNGAGFLRGRLPFVSRGGETFRPHLSRSGTNLRTLFSSRLAGIAHGVAGKCRAMDWLIAPL